MSASVSFVQPANQAIVQTTNTTIIIDVVDNPGTHPARQLTITRGISIFVWVAGMTTYLHPDYSIAISTPAPFTTRFTLTKLTPWVNPDTMLFTATYLPDGVTPTVANVGFVCANFSIVVADPYSEQSDVRSDANVGFTVSANTPIRSGSMRINGVQAYSLDINNEITWNYPDFEGAIVAADTIFTATVNPRRKFDPEATVTIELNIGLTTNFEFAGLAVVTYKFHIRPRTTPLFNPELNRTRLDQPFRNSPALEAFRRTVVGALKVRVVTPGGDVLAYSRIQKSSLRTVASQFQRPDLAIEVDRLVPEDLAPVVSVDTEAKKIDVLWDAALNEARRLPIDPLFIDLVERTYRHPYPQERVGAISALLLAVAQVFTP